MTKKQDKSSSSDIDLRQRAEDIASRIDDAQQENIGVLSALEVQQIVYDLRVHKIQLEMQNEELRTAQSNIEISQARYFELYNMSPVGYCTLNETGIIQEANLTIATMLDIPRNQLVRKSFSRFVFKADKDNFYLKTKKLLVNQQTMSCDLRMLTSNKGTLWVHLTSTSRKKADGTVELHLGVSNITEQRLIQQQQRIAAIAFESLDGMLITDAEGLILQANRAFMTMSGYSDEEIVGQTQDLFNSGRHTSSFFVEMKTQLKQQGKWSGEIWARRKNSEVYPIWMTVNEVRNNEDDVSHYVYTIRDITAKKVAEEQILNLAFYDPLTKLPNRRLMLDRLEHALSSRARHKRLGAVMMIDLDNFKTLNDSLGHDVGDQLLISVASRLESCMREGDTVSRIGGDEFVVIIEDLYETILVERQVEAVAKKFIFHLNEPYFLQQSVSRDSQSKIEYHCSCSVGIALFSEDTTTVDELIKQADTAMYAAKADGRNTLRFFAPEMQTLMVARIKMENDLHEAIKKEQFVLYYQPIVTCKNKLIGVEALIRWLHPKRGVIMPGDFIPIAEASGIILPIGLWVIQNACDQLVKWACVPEMAELSMAVNVSVMQFHQTDFVSQVLTELKRSGANPLRLNLELTESVLIYDMNDVIDKMITLKASGIRFSLDDFGTGYSSLSYLKRLPLDRLKIDQSFVQEINSDQDDAAIAKMIIALSQNLGVEVSAEGIENHAQLDYLEDLGCHVYQGYLFSRPLSLQKFESFAQQV
ncbi:EAL domain-containing protein [Paraglaciecola sp. MB-3u-78]|uniref:EAL domain-containing protein n=1 Tax=Paraglaciecola sp. MB-3u-78 TaxID=2058332 RepID=UPI000C343BB0|nr:EAL domain-containing protein [Paraglaciecola sp. MB-3u-78]PKG98671.1 diguanylate cyclase [Paraglaciecola sp. MB-3u-78]